MNVYGVIMAGGGGTRFWPISRQNKPKQILKLSGQDAMINETIERIKKIITKENLFIVTNEKQGDIVKKTVQENCMHENVLLEPAARNTAACILYSAMKIQKKYGEGIMCVFPSDHYIKDNRRFLKIMEEAIEVVKKFDKLVTIGIKPTFPSTGYGYILVDDSSHRKSGDYAYPVVEFVEKPTFEKAKVYVESGKYLWNSGMFVWKVSKIIEKFKQFLPKLYVKMEEIASYFDTPKEEEKLKKIYPNLLNTSIDYGIMERSDEVLVIPGDFGWNDVGSWDSLGCVYDNDNDGNIIRGKHISISTKNSILYSNNRLITTIGIDNMIVVETDDAIMICPKDRAQDVKQLVDILKDKNMKEYL